MIIKLQLKDSYPRDHLNLFGMNIVKYEARSFSREESFLRKLANNVSAITLIDEDESTINEEINEMVKPESLIEESFVEEVVKEPEVIEMPKIKKSLKKKSLKRKASKKK